MKIDRIVSVILFTTVTGVKAASDVDIDAMLPKWNPPRIETSLKTATMELLVSGFTVYPARVHHVAEKSAGSSFAREMVNLNHGGSQTAIADSAFDSLMPKLDKILAQKFQSAKAGQPSQGTLAADLNLNGSTKR